MIGTTLLLLIVVPIAIGITTLAYFGWKRRKAQRAANEATKGEEAAAQNAQTLALPSGSLELALDGLPSDLDPSVLVGKIMLVLVGTFAASLASRLLQLLAISGLSEAVNSILLIEPDAGQLAKFLAKVPPAVLDRLVVVQCSSLPGGGANRSAEWMKSMRPLWVPEVRAKATEVCDLHLRRILNRTHVRSDDPAQVLVFISEGATGWMGPEALDVILPRVPGAQCIAFTAYPVDDTLRARTPELLAAYHKVGCTGFIAADNAPDEECPSRDPLANDLGMTAIVTTPVSAAAQTSDAAAEGNNMYTLVLPNGAAEPHALPMASYRTATIGVPAERFQPHPSLRPRYYVIGDAMTSATLNALAQVEKPARRAVSAPFGYPRTARFDLILTALEPRSLRDLEDSVVTARQASAMPPASRNYHAIFAGMHTLINPEKPTCPIIVVSLEALTYPKEHLAQVAAPAPALTTPEPLQLPENGNQTSNKHL